MKNKIKLFFRNLFLILSSIIIALSIYIKNSFNSSSVEQLIYSIQNTDGTSVNAIKEGTIFTIIVSIVVFLILNIPVLLKRIYKYKTKLVVKLGKKKFNFTLFPIQNLVSYSLLVLILSTLICLYYIGFFEYIESRMNTTQIYEEYYVDPKNVNITFPEEKQNLIYIYLESFENTFASVQNGGAQQKSYISSLEQLALDNLNFSNTNKLGGAYQLGGTSWTAGAMVGHSTGLPLNVSIDGNTYAGYSGFMSGATSIGEILENSGYKNYLMIGSDSNFGGRKDLYQQHGNYTIYDYNTAKDEKLIEDDYHVWWGYEDKKLLEFAKNKLLTVASQNESFNFTMLTADTHFVDGYLDESCDTPFDSQYANVFNCSSNMIYEFVKWIQEQDFYDNTTIVITGDHLTMQTDFVNNIDSSYKRTIYNTFINSRINTDYSKNREFSNLDMFPTTLASLGVEIEGDRLALGTNLFSGTATLVEELGLDYFNEELKKKSDFYNEEILGDSYYEMLSGKK